MTSKATDKPISIQAIIGKGYNEFWNSKKFYRVVKGSRGSKKSVTVQIEAIYKMMKYPWKNYLVIRRYQNTHRDSTFAGLQWAANWLGVSHLWEFKVSPMEATYRPTGQKILFRGFDDPIKLTSIQLAKGSITDLWIEEGFEVESMSKIDTVTEAMRGVIPYEGAFRQVTITFNPWSDTHWLKKEFFDENRDDTFTLTTTYKCNEWLDDATIKRYERLYTTNPRRAKIVCDGDWGIAEGLVYENVTYRPIDPEEIDPNKFELLIGLDFGYAHDPTALIVSWWDRDNNTIYVVDEHYEVGMKTGDIAKMIKTKGYSKSVIIADSAEGRLIDELKYNHGLTKIQRSRKGKDSVRAGIDKLQSQRIIVDESCVNTKEEFYSYAYKFDNIEGRYTNEPVDKYNHLMDALRYSLQAENKIKVNLIRGGI